MQALCHRNLAVTARCHVVYREQSNRELGAPKLGSPKKENLMMTGKTGGSLKWLTLAAVALAMEVCGCSAMDRPAPAQQASVSTPRVQDCGIVSIGSPTRYVCNDKVYTSFELAKLRLASEKLK